MQKKVYVYIAVSLIVIWSLFPVYVLIIASLSPVVDIITNGFPLIPIDPTNVNYRWILQLFNSQSSGNAPDIRQSFLNSVILSTVSSFIGVAISAVAGYAFGRLRFRFRNKILFLLVSSMMIPSIAIVIPYFIIFTQVGLIGTYGGVILTYLTLILPLATWVLSGYFATFPPEVEKAARIDGCTRLKAVWRIVFPMAASGIVAVWLLSLMFTWNEMLFGVLIGANTVKPVQPLILQFSSTGFSATGSSVVTISIIFPIALATLFKRYIMRLNIIQPE